MLCTKNTYIHDTIVCNISIPTKNGLYLAEIDFNDGDFRTFSLINQTVQLYKKYHVTGNYLITVRIRNNTQYSNNSLISGELLETIVENNFE